MCEPTSGRADEFDVFSPKSPHISEFRATRSTLLRATNPPSQHGGDTLCANMKTTRDVD